MLGLRRLREIIEVLFGRLHLRSTPDVQRCAVAEKGVQRVFPIARLKLIAREITGTDAGRLVFPNLFDVPGRHGSGGGERERWVKSLRLADYL